LDDQRTDRTGGKVKKPSPPYTVTAICASLVIGALAGLILGRDIRGILGLMGAAYLAGILIYGAIYAVVRQQKS